MDDIDKTFDRLRRISIEEMAGILNNGKRSDPNFWIFDHDKKKFYPTKSAENILKQYGWDIEEYIKENDRRWPPNGQY